LHGPLLPSIVVRELLWIMSNLFAAAASIVKDESEDPIPSVSLLFKCQLWPRRQMLQEYRDYPGVAMQAAWLLRNATSCTRDLKLVHALVGQDAIYMLCDLLGSEEPDILLPALVRGLGSPPAAAASAAVSSFCDEVRAIPLC